MNSFCKLNEAEKAGTDYKLCPEYRWILPAFYTGSVEVPVSIYNVKLSGSNTYVKVDDSTNIYNGAQQLPKTVVHLSAVS